MNVKITADGTLSGTRVVTESGIELSDSLESVTFTHKGGDLPKVEMRLSQPFATGLQGSGEFSMIHPHTGKVVVLRAIELADGERLEFTPAGSGSGSDTSGQAGR